MSQITLQYSLFPLRTIFPDPAESSDSPAALIDNTEIYKDDRSSLNKIRLLQKTTFPSTTLKNKHAVNFVK